MVVNIVKMVSLRSYKESAVLLNKCGAIREKVGQDFQQAVRVCVAVYSPEAGGAFLS